LAMRLTQDDCPSISFSRLRALGEVTEDMGSVGVTIGEVSREVRLSHLRFPNGGGWSFFLCPSCGRRARVLKLFEKIACWRCTCSGPSRPLPWLVQLGDRTQRIERAEGEAAGRPGAREAEAGADDRQALADRAGAEARGHRRAEPGERREGCLGEREGGGFRRAALTSTSRRPGATLSALAATCG
jgi:hypothetical protein